MKSRGQHLVGKQTCHSLGMLIVVGFTFALCYVRWTRTIDKSLGFFLKCPRYLWILLLELVGIWITFSNFVFPAVCSILPSLLLFIIYVLDLYQYNYLDESGYFTFFHLFIFSRRNFMGLFRKRYLLTLKITWTRSKYSMSYLRLCVDDCLYGRANSLPSSAKRIKWVWWFDDETRYWLLHQVTLIKKGTLSTLDSKIWRQGYAFCYEVQYSSPGSVASTVNIGAPNRYQPVGTSLW